MLTKDNIFSMGAGRRTKKIRVKPWGGEVLLRAVSAGEMDHIEALGAAFDKDPLSVASHLRARVCAYFLANEDGSRMFGDGDMDRLNALSAAGMTIVYEEGMRFNKRAMIEELEKNSETTRSESSGTS